MFGVLGARNTYAGEATYTVKEVQSASALWLCL